MRLIDYLPDGPSARMRQLSVIAEAVDSSAQYLNLVALNHKRVSPKLAIAIERATNGEVTKESLRPDIWPPPSEQIVARSAKRIAIQKAANKAEAKPAKRRRVA